MMSPRLAAPLLLLGLLICGRAGADPPDSAGARQEAQRLDALPPVAPHGKAAIDRSGRAETGRASSYSARFNNRKMADGRPMNPHANIAASKTLPIGSTAKVTNVENGRSATVTVEDRGPYVNGRVVDLSPHVAQQLDITRKQGVAPVVVKPITVPQPNGEVKLGAGAAEVSPAELQEAAATTARLTAGASGAGEAAGKAKPQQVATATETTEHPATGAEHAGAAAHHAAARHAPAHAAPAKAVKPTETAQAHGNSPSHDAPANQSLAQNSPPVSPDASRPAAPVPATPPAPASHASVPSGVNH